MNLKQLEAFVKVAELKNYSKAAKQMYLTQPTVSAHIFSLEKELETRLFIRSTKEVYLTDEGKMLYKYAKEMVDLEAKIKESFSRNEEAGSSGITIAASTIPSQYLLPGLLSEFSKKYPGEQIKIMEADSGGVVESIVDHRVDVGFTGTVLEKKHCTYIPFYQDELVIITPNTEKYRKRKNASDIAWLKEENIIFREEGSGTRKEAEKQLVAAGIPLEELKVIASMENQETIKNSVAQGMGISVLSKLAATEEVEAGKLLAFTIPGTTGGRSINLVYNKNYPLTKTVQRFIKVVKESGESLR
ncbi:LysR family transcriptional regulator [Lachnospiraceae bacterium OttesenSCG-928-J05]|nr:LysR family transcriptional regulator [Lachnospiraceae bacterium OttesenSCG-928-J05]